ncbi:carbonic anhydrase [Helicobacter didelphidarum]|uniref:Carbonic anhydrase n=1 Tax=Helicobacter didelphidarum TaxID=2040648 RepID=A0A3D8ILV7_9HELI|nr:carbonic anhydrase family protein [Helicobacter didelphidarum]RDU66209.1 carbonic anhydrase [Helicobacter didelphidarum]
MIIRHLFLTTLLSVSSMVTSIYADNWGYDTTNGPDTWGKNPDFEACDIGQFQSPINILSDTAKKTTNELNFNYQLDSKDIINNGHSMQVNFDKQGKLLFKKKQYNLIQLHFHTPSENQIDSKAYPLEMHLVHENDNGELLVVGIFFEEGKENAVLQKMMNAFPQEIGKTQVFNKLDVKKIIPKITSYYAFVGSLTTPPCNEKVQWVVLKNSMQASKKQINFFHSVLHGNARGVQQLNNREITSAD